MAEQNTTPQPENKDFAERLSAGLQTLRTYAYQFWQRTSNWLREPANRRKLLKWGLLTGVAGAVFLFLLATLTYFGAFGKLPTYAELKSIRNNTASEVYSEDGLILGKYYIQNRVNADIDEISPNVINALIATEDARFFEHQGIDFRAWVRVLLRTVLLMDESGGGGSTISQQLSKNLYARQEYRFFSVFINKMKETYTARRLEKLYSKEELLNLYLNTVPFGGDMYGIKVAAQRFFGTSPNRLQPEEAAMLVGMLKANTYYNPVRNPERALSRRNVVLGQMTKYGYLTESERDSLRQLPLEVDYFREGNNEGLATYFREHLRLELEEVLKDFKKADGTPYNLYTDGLKVYTSINARMQRYAEEAMREHMAQLQEKLYENWKKRTAPWDRDYVVEGAMKRSARYKALQAKGFSEEKIREIFNTPIQMTIFSWEKGEIEQEMTPLDSLRYYLSLLNTGFLAAEPVTGLVRAWVGGIDHEYFQYDHIKSRRQVGSTFKPIVYAAALENGMLPCEYTANELVTYSEYNDWQPRNANGEYGGVYSMEGALSQSINSVSVDIIMRTGSDPVSRLAKLMGIKGSIPNEPSIALGTPEASLYEMVQVYGTFANKGRRPSLHYLDRIETAEGEIIVQFRRPDSGESPQVLSEERTAMMVKMMQAVVDSGTARRLRYRYGLRNDIAGKTGTTQNNSDGWFVGFTPKIVAGVWVGAETPQVHFRSTSLGQGGYSALPIWGSFMQKVYRDKNLRDWHYGQFTPPADSILALMDCPHFLPEMPIFVNDYGVPDTSSFFQRLFNNFRRQEYEDYYREANWQEMPQRRDGESDRSYERRIQKWMREEQQDNDQDREARKKAWSKILFGNDEKEKKEGGNSRRQNND